METTSLTLVIIFVAVAAADNIQRPLGEGKRDTRGMCFTSEGTFRHGQIFHKRTNRCLKFRCEFGRVRVLSVSCPFDGQCYPVGRRWTGRDCHLYTCSRQHYNSYKIDRLRSGCRDANRRCRNPGEVFPFNIHGRIYSQCTCRTTPSSIKYNCKPQYHQIPSLP